MIVAASCSGVCKVGGCKGSAISFPHSLDLSSGFLVTGNKSRGNRSSESIDSRTGAFRPETTAMIL